MLKTNFCTYRGAEKSLARPTSQCILFDGENISFDPSLVFCIYVWHLESKERLRIQPAQLFHFS